MIEQPEHAAILIVDDDEINRSVLQTRFKRVGFEELATAGSGKEALEIAQQRRPDIVLLDVMMPEMNGFEVTQQLRTMYPHDFIPIILVSALQKAQDRVQGIEAGANDFISKPYDFEELLARVQSLLALKRARDELQVERERLALLFDTSRMLAAELEYDSLLHQIIRLTTSLANADKTLLVTLDADGAFREKIVYSPGGEPRSTDTIDPRVLEEGLIGWVIRHRQPVFLEDVQNDPRWAHLPDDDETWGAAIAVPLIRGDRVLGAGLMVSKQAGAFVPEHLNLLMAIGNQAGITLQNAELFEETRQQRARTEALLNQTGDPVLVTDSEGRISRINPAAERILRLGSDAVNQPLGEVFSLKLADLLYRAQDRHSPVSGEYTISRGEDDQMTFNVSISPVEEVGFVLLWRDVSALKENERIRLATERAERQRVLDALSRYMSTALVERVLGDPDILSRRERRDALILFADLRGFTRLTAEHPPNDVIMLLNDVFTEMIDIVYQHEGVVFDIAGDELMVGFNVPYSQPDARHRALATAIAMQQRFAELQQKWAAQGMNVGMGVGINSGQVVLGHVGGRSRMSYAMVGEAVNVAHRLVEIAEDGQIVVATEVLADGLPDPGGLAISELDSRPIKGVDRPLPMTLIELS